MILLPELISPAQIRSILTVSEADLPDETLSGYGLEDDVAIFLDSKLTAWEDFDAVPTLHRKLRVLVKYKAAAIVAVTAPVFILKKMTDGSNEGQRSDKDGFVWLQAKLEAKVQESLDGILDELGTNYDNYTISFVGRSIPSRDPITEPRE